MESKRKPCPICRKAYARIAEHIKSVHQVFGEEFFKLQDAEKERVNFLAIQSVYLSDLQKEFRNYLQVALSYAKMQIPVLERGQTKRAVVHLTVDDIRQRIFEENAAGTVTGRSPVQSTARVPSLPRSSGTSGTWSVTVSPNQERPRSRISSPVANAPAEPIRQASAKPGTSSGSKVVSPEPVSQMNIDEHSPVSRKEKVQAATRVVTMADVHAPAEPDMTSESECDSEVMSPPQSPESMSSPIRRSGRRTTPRVLDTSGESEGTSRPIKKRRVEVVASDSDSDTDLSDEEGMGVKQVFRRRYTRVGMFLDSNEQAYVLQNNYFIKVLELAARSTKTTAETLGRKDSVKNDLSICMKIMKFCAPGNDIDKFHWDHLTSNKLNLLAIALTTKVKLKSYSISNYWKQIRHMCREGAVDERASTHTKSILDDSVNRLSKLGKVNSKSISQDLCQKKANDANVRTKDLSDEILLLFSTFEKNKVKLASLINQAKDGKGLSPKDLKYVNCMFNLFNMLNCNRPGVFSNMELDRVTLAKSHRQVDADGNEYHFLSTARHKTASTVVAYIYMKQEMWQHLLDYVQYVRPKPISRDFKNTLFLNSEGKSIYNASNDLSTFLAMYEPKLKGLTATRFRKVVTTLSQRHLDKHQQNIVHAMLAHSAATAERHYLMGNDQSLPHRAGIPLIEKILRKCSGDQEPVSDVLSGSDALTESMTQAAEATLNDYVQKVRHVQIDTAPAEDEEDRASNSGESSGTISSNSSSASEMTRPLSDLQKMRRIVDLCQISADSDLPKAADFKRVQLSDPSLSVSNDAKAIKSMSGFANEKRRDMRAAIIVDELRRTLAHPNLEERIEKALRDRNWFNVKTFNKSIAECKKATRVSIVRVTANEKNRTEEIELARRIREQDWPLIFGGNAGIMGQGAYAKKAIPKGTVICDYHGELVDEKTGDKRYLEEYEGRPDNCYMFMFQFEGAKYYIDGVKKCECPCLGTHKVKTIKGRLLNNSKTNVNVIVKAKRINGQIALLMYAKHDIEKNSSLVFDYNCHKDKLSDQQDWMVE